MDENQWRQALFWLAESGNEKAIAALVEMLTGNR